MEIEAKFSVPDDMLFSKYSKCDRIGEFFLGKVVINHVVDNYLDTIDNDIWNSGYKMRVRDSEGHNYITIKSSMIGTFYRSSSPEEPSFVNIGDSIKEGDTICIIEAMKLFNEIESEVNGTIVKVLVDDSTPIEFDQPLFLVDPS